VVDDGLEVEVVDADGSLVVLISGEIDVDTGPQLRSVLDGFAVSAPVVLDCADVGFIDSTGVNLLLRQSMRMRFATGTIRVRHLSAQLRRLLQITGLEEFLEADMQSQESSMAPGTDGT
jgi:anti-anti-sigma factor